MQGISSLPGRHLAWTSSTSVGSLPWLKNDKVVDEFVHCYGLCHYFIRGSKVDSLNCGYSTEQGEGEMGIGGEGGGEGSIVIVIVCIGCTQLQEREKKSMTILKKKKNCPSSIEHDTHPKIHFLFHVKQRNTRCLLMLWLSYLFLMVLAANPSASECTKTAQVKNYRLSGRHILDQTNKRDAISSSSSSIP